MATRSNPGPIAALPKNPDPILPRLVVENVFGPYATFFDFAGQDWIGVRVGALVEILEILRGVEVTDCHLYKTMHWPKGRA